MRFFFFLYFSHRPDTVYDYRRFGATCDRLSSSGAVFVCRGSGAAFICVKMIQTSKIYFISDNKSN